MHDYLGDQQDDLFQSDHEEEGSKPKEKEKEPQNDQKDDFDDIFSGAFETIIKAKSVATVTTNK